MRRPGHGLVLYLPDKLDLAIAKLRSNFELGRSFSGLLALTEGLYSFGALSDEDYTFFKDRYSTPLLERPVKELGPVRRDVKRTLEQIRAKTRIEELEKQYGNALNQWSIMKERSKQWFLEHATKDLKKYPDLQNAKLLLDLTNPNFGEVRQ